MSVEAQEEAPIPLHLIDGKQKIESIGILFMILDAQTAVEAAQCNDEHCQVAVLHLQLNFTLLVDTVAATLYPSDLPAALEVPMPQIVPNTCILIYTSVCVTLFFSLIQTYIAHILLFTSHTTPWGFSCLTSSESDWEEIENELRWAGTSDK